MNNLEEITNISETKEKGLFCLEIEKQTIKTTLCAIFINISSNEELIKQWINDIKLFISDCGINHNTEFKLKDEDAEMKTYNHFLKDEKKEMETIIEKTKRLAERVFLK